MHVFSKSAGRDSEVYSVDFFVYNLYAKRNNFFAYVVIFSSQEDKICTIITVYTFGGSSASAEPVFVSAGKAGNPLCRRAAAKRRRYEMPVLRRLHFRYYRSPAEQKAREYKSGTFCGRSSMWG